MSGILTQDSISLTESLDGVRFCYLATSSRKAGTIRLSTKHPTHSDATKGADSFFLLSSVENWYRGGTRHVLVTQMFQSGWSNSALCHWTLYMCLRHEIKATCFPLWWGIVSSECIPVKLMPSFTPSTKYPNLLWHWFCTDSWGNKTHRNVTKFFKNTVAHKVKLAYYKMQTTAIVLYGLHCALYATLQSLPQTQLSLIHSKSLYPSPPSHIWSWGSLTP